MPDNPLNGLSSNKDIAGVTGNNTAEPQGGFGVFGRADGAFGTGVVGVSAISHGMHGVNGKGVSGISQNGVGVFGSGGHRAGLFQGNIEVTGDVQLTGGDCAEDFDIACADRAEPGTIMVLGDGGMLQPSEMAYDKRVVGVISGAGNYKPGIVLDKHGPQANRKPIALVGKVYCKVDAQ